MFILLTGGSSTGKSTLAKNLSQELNINWISADDIRIAIQQTHDENHPVNFFLQPDVFLKHEAELVKKHREVSEIVCKGLESVISHNNHIQNNLIIEGDDILPEFISEMQNNYQNIKSIFISETNKDKIKQNILNRNRHPQDTQSQEFKNNIEFIYQDNLNLLEQAKKFKLNILEARPFESLKNRGLKLIEDYAEK